MNDFRADLHCHSTCSDGSLSPAQIIHLAKEKGLSGLSITDHDSIDAYENAFSLARTLDISLISGVEFSAVHNGFSVHILGYSFALNNPTLIDFCEKHQERRLHRNQAILARLSAAGMPISEDEVIACTMSEHPSAKHTIGRPHIALAMLKKGYVQSITDAFKLYLGEDKRFYVRGTAFSAQETIDIIHQANGFALIAHPHLIKENQLVPQLLKMNFDGLEGYYARLTPVQNERWVKAATKKNWMITGGSDFHGDIKPSIDLGSSWTKEDVFRILEERFKKNNLDQA